MKERTVSILGTEYSIEYGLGGDSSDGDCGFYNKHIRIRPIEKMLDSDCTEEEKELRQKEVVRHELFHAFFFESGMKEWAYNEDIVDYLAAQSPKIFKAFMELELL